MIASITKTIQLQAITAKADITYAMAHLATWWTLEAYLVIIATSIPTLRPIMSTNRGKEINRTRGRISVTAIRLAMFIASSSKEVMIQNF